jgi:DNA-binding XRE family transcriptional regulator
MCEGSDWFEAEGMYTNSLKEIRESFLISKAELARMADLSVDTLTRIEHGKPCRIETKRKILLALGLKLSDKKKVFH